jgi:hypothetical protein
LVVCCAQSHALVTESREVVAAASSLVPVVHYPPNEQRPVAAAVHAGALASIGVMATSFAAAREPVPALLAPPR